MQALLSRTSKLVPWISSILLVPKSATKIALPPLPSVCGQFVVLAPMRLRLKCGPLGAPFPVALVNERFAKIARASVAMVIATTIIFFKSITSHIYCQESDMGILKPRGRNEGLPAYRRVAHLQQLPWGRLLDPSFVFVSQSVKSSLRHSGPIG